jgi:hypothetical protein
METLHLSNVAGVVVDYSLSILLTVNVLGRKLFLHREIDAFVRKPFGTVGTFTTFPSFAPSASTTSTPFTSFTFGGGVIGWLTVVRFRGFGTDTILLRFPHIIVSLFTGFFKIGLGGSGDHGLVVHTQDLLDRPTVTVETDFWFMLRIFWKDVQLLTAFAMVLFVAVFGGIREDRIFSFTGTLGLLFVHLFHRSGP